MDNLKISKGVWKVDSPVLNGRTSVNIKGNYRCIDVWFHQEEEMTLKEAKANANLIAEAGTVTNECGLTPRQLLEQRDMLIKVLENVLTINFDIDSSGRTVKRFTLEEIQDIKKAIGNG